MKFMLSLLVFGYVALANPAPSLPLHPGGIGGFFKGPNSETIIKGPDGSVITAAAEGGEVLTNLGTIVVAEQAPVTAVPVVEAIAVPAVVETQQSSDLIGPSGRIATQGSHAVIAGPASTTVTGPAVVAETVVRGAPIIATAAPVVTISGVPLSVTTTPQAVATASVSPVLSTASASSALGASVIASAANNLATASVTATPLPILPASPVVNGISGLGGLIGINDRIALTTGGISPPLPIIPSTIAPAGIPVNLAGINDRIDLRLIQDQLAIDNRQLNLNPALIPSINIIPPDISVTPKTVIRGLRPTPGTLLTTPGLGAVAGTPNIQREEADITLNVTPNPLQLQSQVQALQNQQALLNNQIQLTQQITGPSNIQRGEAIALNVTPNPLQIDPQVRLSPQQVAALQNQQALLNQQIRLSQQVTPSNIQRGEAVITPNPFQIDSQVRLNPQEVAALQSQLNQQIQQIQQVTRQRGEDINVNVTPNPFQIDSQVRLSPQEVAALQNQQILLNQIQQVTGPSIQRGEGGITPNPFQIDSQVRLSPQEVAALQNQQALLNNQIQRAQQAAVNPNQQGPRNENLFTPTSDPRLATGANQFPSLAEVQREDILSSELAKSGIDASQLQLTNVPLSAVSGLPDGLNNGLRGAVINDRKEAAWGRFQRETKKTEETTKKDN